MLCISKFSLIGGLGINMNVGRGKHNLLPRGKLIVYRSQNSVDFFSEQCVLRGVQNRRQKPFGLKEIMVQLETEALVVPAITADVRKIS